MFATKILVGLKLRSKADQKIKTLFLIQTKQVLFCYKLQLQKYLLFIGHLIL